VEAASSPFQAYQPFTIYLALVTIRFEWLSQRSDVKWDQLRAWKAMPFNKNCSIPGYFQHLG